MQRIRYLIGLVTLALGLIGAIALLRFLDPKEDAAGLLLRVEFRDARGLRPGADVRYRGVPAGSVRSVSIAEDGQKALVELVLDAGGAAHACVNSVFWIVTPRFAGITGGATGLETLVRDTYVAFSTPAEAGSPLRHGSLIGGAERPAPSLDPEQLDPLQHGDLLMTMLVAENHGLKPGSPVVFRGMQTGDVRRIDLAEDGTHVEVLLRIERGYRHTITDRTEFWIARPHVSGALFGGFTVTDMSALLSPFVSYYSPPSIGVPVEDGYRVAASASRPDVQPSAVPAAALKRGPPRPGRPPDDALVLVRIVYAAVELDTWSPNDPVRYEGTGVLYLDREGRAAVVTARSVVDGNYLEQDAFGGEPEIAQEQIKVLVPGGPVLRGHRVWVAPDGSDLAVLVLADAPPDLPVTRPARFSFAPIAAGTAAMVLAVRDGGSRLDPARLLLPEQAPELERYRGGAIEQDGLVVGIYGVTARRSTRPAAVPIDAVPADLRPR